MPASNRIRLQIFIEPELKPIIKAQSKRFSGCTHPSLGSDSWYARQAILEKLKRDFPNIVKIESVKELFECIR